MNKTARRALQASAALTGLATAVGLTGGTALAAGQPTALPSHSAPSDAGTSLNAPTSSPSQDLHSFSMPTMKTDRSDRSDSSDDVPSPERADRSSHYSHRGYKNEYNRESDKALRHSNSNGEFGYRNDDSKTEIVSPGYNGDNKANGSQDADDFDNDNEGYHAPRGANRYANSNYYGYSETNGQGESGKFFGGLF
jgi:hypothetical protein